MRKEKWKEPLKKETDRFLTKTIIGSIIISQLKIKYGGVLVSTEVLKLE